METASLARGLGVEAEATVLGPGINFTAARRVLVRWALSLFMFVIFSGLGFRA